MSRKDLSKILYAVMTLDHRHNQVANLRDHRKDQSADSKQYKIDVNVEEVTDYKAVSHVEQGTEYDTANTSLNRFFRADILNELMLTKEYSCKISENISDPCAHEDQQIQEMSIAIIIVNIQDCVQCRKHIEQNGKKAECIKKSKLSMRTNDQAKKQEKLLQPEAIFMIATARY